MIAELLPAIRSCAARFVARGARLAKEDLQQAALLEVVRYIDRWDPTRATAKTYFYRRISGAMIDALRGEKMPGTRRDLTTWGAPVAFSAYTATLPSGERDATIEESFPDEAADEDRVLQEGALYLEELFARLEPTKQAIMESLYLRGRTMKQAGQLVGLSESRVSQLHGQILSEMRGWSEFA